MPFLWFLNKLRVFEEVSSNTFVSNGVTCSYKLKHFWSGWQLWPVFRWQKVIFEGFPSWLHRPLKVKIKCRYDSTKRKMFELRKKEESVQMEKRKAIGQKFNPIVGIAAQFLSTSSRLANASPRCWTSHQSHPEALRRRSQSTRSFQD